MPNGLALAISLLIVLMFLAYIVSMILAFFSPYYSTPKKVVKDILKIFKLKKSDTFADLGSGDGRIVFEVNKMYGCKSVGYEISPVLLMIVKLRKLFTQPFNSKIHFKEESFFNTNLSDYNVIYCCLPKDVLGTLEKKFKKELKKDSQVFLFKESLPNKKGEKVKVGNYHIYRYTY